MTASLLLMKSVLTPLAKSILLPLAFSTGMVAAGAAIEKKICWSGTIELITQMKKLKI